VDSDGGWAGVAGAAGLAAFLDAVAVVADAFECPWAGAVAALEDSPAADLSQDLVSLPEPPPKPWRHAL